MLALISFHPVSTHPGRYALAHRTASSHAVEMYAMGDYLDHAGRHPAAYLDVWAYPYGGIARPLAIPSLAAGSVLCKVMSPRTAFNVVFLVNIVLSGMAFYLVGRRLGFRNSAAVVLGGLVVFHPLLQSFILRGQIENTMLWTVGFSLLAGISLLTAGRWNPWFFAGASLLPLLVVFSTPYYAIFYLLLCPVVLLFVTLDDRVAWKPRLLVSCVGAFVIAAILLAVAVRFYVPDQVQAGDMVNLNPGSADMGLDAVLPVESLYDLVLPGGLLRDEKPFLGTAFMAAVLFGAVGGFRDKRRRWKTACALAGAACFAVLAAGRTLGPVTLPVTVIDRAWPGFRNVAMLFRALPFMAVCGGLVAADSMNEQRPRRAAWLAAALLLLVAVDGFLVSPLSGRTRGRYYLDDRLDMDDAIFALPQRHVADLPVIDLPPHRHDTPELWAAYTYYQTEHGQRIVWCDVPPRELPPVMRLATHMFDDPRAYADDVAMRDELKQQFREAGIGLVVLHRKLVMEKAKLPDIESLLDSCFPRRNQSDTTVVWQVLRTPCLRRDLL